MAQLGLTGPFTLVMPPLGLLYLAAYLRERFPVEIQIIDQRLEYLSQEQLVRKIVSFEPDIVGLGYMTPFAAITPGIVRAIREKRPDAFIVLGGPHVSAVRETALAQAPGANAAVAGEGELAMDQVLQAYLDDGDMAHVPGLIRRTGDGEVIANPGEMPLIEDLDTLPFPAYDLIDIHKYRHRESGVPVPGRNYIPLFSSRGCPYKCKYCHNIFGRRFRMHSPERIVEEIKFFTRNFGVEEVDLIDDNFNLNRKRVMDFADLLLKEVGPIKLTLPQLRADLLDEDVVMAMAQAGMYIAGCALESGSPRIQKLIDKNLDISKFVEAIELCVRYGAFTLGYAIFGFPTETAEEMLETIRVTTQSQLHTSFFFILIPFPGTRIHEYAAAHMPEKLKNVSYDNVDFWRSHINLSVVSDKELYYYNGLAYRRFYLQPRRIYRILRDYPRPSKLPIYSKYFVTRLVRGVGRRVAPFGSH